MSHCLLFFLFWLYPALEVWRSLITLITLLPSYVLEGGQPVLKPCRDLMRTEADGRTGAGELI